MNQQKLDKLFKDLKVGVDEISSLIKEAERARTRKEIATTEANNLEERNKLATTAMETDIQIKKQVMLDELSVERANLGSKIKTLKTVKSKLQDEIDELTQLKDNKGAALQPIEDEKRILEDSMMQGNLELHSINKQVIETQAELKDTENRYRLLNTEMARLLKAQQAVEEDVTVMQDEATRLEDKIIDQDTIFKNKSHAYESQIAKYEFKLKNLSEKIQEADKRDKSIRQALAERKMTLEKQEKNIRKREILIEEGESRLQSQSDYMKI